MNIEFISTFAINYGVYSMTTCVFTAAAVLCFTFWKKMPKTVQCWFCHFKNSVDYECVNSWNCPKCEQYNGFTKDGDYNMENPRQYDQRFNNTYTNLEDHEHFKLKLPSLCKYCNYAQDLKVKQLAEFIPRNDNNYDEEIEHFSKQLENVYRLCNKCDKLVYERLEILKSKYPTPRKLNSTNKYIEQNNKNSNWTTTISIILTMIILFIIVNDYLCHANKIQKTCDLKNITRQSIDKFLKYTPKEYEWFKYIPQFLNLSSIYALGLFVESLNLFNKKTVEVGFIWCIWIFLCCFKTNKIIEFGISSTLLLAYISYSIWKQYQINKADVLEILNNEKYFENGITENNFKRNYCQPSDGINTIPHRRKEVTKKITDDDIPVSSYPLCTSTPRISPTPSQMQRPLPPTPVQPVYQKQFNPVSKNRIPDLSLSNLSISQKQASIKSTSSARPNSVMMNAYDIYSNPFSSSKYESSGTFSTKSQPVASASFSELSPPPSEDTGSTSPILTEFNQFNPDNYVPLCTTYYTFQSRHHQTHMEHVTNFQNKSYQLNENASTYYMLYGIVASVSILAISQFAMWYVYVQKIS